MPVLISGIEKGSAAEKAGIKSGEKLVAINNHEINDGLDYRFYSIAERLEIVLEKHLKPIIVLKDEYEELGCLFDSYLIDKQHSCKNKCMFCFVDQMPKGLRESLYFKDDDERLSFLFGNYITLTNISEKEIQRIIDMRIQPINISVHTTNPKLRVEIMKNPNAGDVLKYIPMLAKAGTTMNCQLVLMPGINDGEELKKSIEDLSAYMPHIQSLAAVPVGLTKYRDGLPEIMPYNSTEAAKQLDIMLNYGDKYLKEKGSRFIFPSDEWFLLSKRNLPPVDFYEGYHQLENGVGMWRLFYDEFFEELANLKKVRGKHEADIITGTLTSGLMNELADVLNEKFPKCKLHVHTVQNNFFGNNVTVTGLLTGKDIIKQLKGNLKSKKLILPACVLRAQGDLFLDDVSINDLEKEIGVKVTVNLNGAGTLIDNLINS